MKEEKLKITEKIVEKFVEMTTFSELKNDYIDSLFFQYKALKYAKAYQKSKREAWKMVSDLYPEKNLEKTKSLEWRIGWDFIVAKWAE